MPGRDFGNLLVDRNGIAIAWPKPTAGQPNLDTVVMMSESAWVMQPADRCDRIAEFLERLQRPRQLIALARRGDLIIQRMDAVGQINKSAAARSRRRFGPS